MALSIGFRKFFMVTILLVLFSSYQFAKAEKLYLDAKNTKAKVVVDRKELKLEITTGSVDNYKPDKRFNLVIGGCILDIWSDRTRYDTDVSFYFSRDKGFYNHVDRPRSLTAVENNMITFQGSNGVQKVPCQGSVTFEEYKPNKYLVEVELSGTIPSSLVISSESQVYKSEANAEKVVYNSDSNAENGIYIPIWLFVLILSIFALIAFFASSSIVGGYKMYKKKNSAKPPMQEAIVSKSATLTVSKESAAKEKKTSKVNEKPKVHKNEAKKIELTEESETSVKSVK